MTPKEVLEFAKKKGLKMVDLKFVDLPGTWQHFTMPIAELEEDCFKDGIGFDGSSIRCFQKIHESDMLLFPDPSSAFMDPVLKVPTLSIICDVADPLTRTYYRRDPRYAGETKYTLSKMLRFSLDAISSFSHRPLQLATLLGFVIST